MKTISQAYLSICKRSVQEMFYHKFIFIDFVPEKRAHGVVSEMKLNELVDGTSNIFNKSNIDRYIYRSNALISGGKSSALHNFFNVEFSACYK